MMDKADSSRQVSKWETLDRDILSVIFRKLNVEDLTMGASRSREEELVEKEAITICCKHKETCESRVSSLIKQSKRFSAKGHVRGPTASNGRDMPLIMYRRNITKFSRGVPENLFFGCCSILDDESIMLAAASMPNIEKLVLPRWCYLSNNSFGFAFSQWKKSKNIGLAKKKKKNLKTLIIAHDYPLTENFEFQAVGESCSNLTNFKYLGYLGKAIAEKIVSYLKNIKRLSLQCSYVSRPGFLWLITGLQNLVILNLPHCKEVDDELERVIIDNIDQAATQNRVKLVYCSNNNCTYCRNHQWFDVL
ncbi:hypothetical protein Bca52824_002684 [Brassica carinata]|uniref:Uncharacterized protein n=1 Tax=Brassica carinata TaxID=52824 RepID=A0A8X7WKN6_BRACI|nr:hypothetical protein Bca52824_002684 [Brassica carinata]